MPDVQRLAAAIEENIRAHVPGYPVARGRGLATLVAVLLQVRSPNLNELAAGLPRAIGSAHDRYQYVERGLKNARIDVDGVMAPYAREVLAQAATGGRTLVLLMDQSPLNSGHEMLMVAVRLRGRAVPLAWRVKATEGGIGFEVQKKLLEQVKALVPAGAAVLLAADRFYGTPALIGWCQEARWGYRIRLKSNLTLSHAGGELTTGEAVRLAPQGLTGTVLCGAVTTNLGILPEKGHPEPWLIAMDAPPSKAKILDYGLRWGIEAMFADFKSRGFGLAQSQIRRPDRLARLLLVMSLALYWAVSFGFHAEAQRQAASGGKKGAP